MTAQQNKWNADAEAAMMGFTIPVESNDHLKHMIGHVLYALSGHYSYDLDEKTEEVFNNAVFKYNSAKDKRCYYFTVNTSHFGVLLTCVREKRSLTMKSGKPTNTGSYAWVENLDAPDCSELGCVFFENKNGKVHRVA